MNSLTAHRFAIGVLAILLAAAACSGQRQPGSRKTPPPPDGNPVHFHLEPATSGTESAVSVYPDPDSSFADVPCVQSKSCYVYLDYEDVNHPDTALSQCHSGSGDYCLLFNVLDVSSGAPFTVSSKDGDGHSHTSWQVNGQFVLVLRSTARTTP